MKVIRQRADDLTGESFLASQDFRDRGLCNPGIPVFFLSAFMKLQFAKHEQTTPMMAHFVQKEVAIYCSDGIQTWAMLTRMVMTKDAVS